MRALPLVLILSLGGCLDWQGSYTAAARDQCRDIINVDERLACMRWAAENDTARREEHRRERARDDETMNADIAEADASTFP